MVQLLKKKGMRLATAESCTGGLLAKRITDIPGSSEVFEMGTVTYSNSIKTQLLDVPESLLPVSYTHLDVYKRQDKHAGAVWSDRPQI